MRPVIYGVDSLKTKELLQKLSLIKRTTIKSDFYYVDYYTTDYYEVDYSDIYKEFQLAYMKYVGIENILYSGTVYIREKKHKDFNEKLEKFLKDKFSTTDES